MPADVADDVRTGQQRGSCGELALEHVLANSPEAQISDQQDTTHSLKYALIPRMPAGQVCDRRPSDYGYRQSQKPQ